MDKIYNKDSVKRILGLIRWGTNGEDELFEAVADGIAEEMDLEGYCDQANFIRAQFDEIPTFEPMEIPSAKETKNKTIESKQIFDKRREQENLKYALDSIKNASKIGNSQTIVDAWRLTNGIVEKLRKAGYKVGCGFSSSTVSTPHVIIDWSGEDEA